MHVGLRSIQEVGAETQPTAPDGTNQEVIEAGFVERSPPLVQLAHFVGIDVNTYDVEGDLVAVTNAELETTEYGHDGLGRMTDMWTPLDYHYTYAYDPNDNLVAVDGPLGYHLGYRYDDNDNLEAEIDPNGGKTKYGYDTSENLVRVENQLPVTTARYTYGDRNEKRTEKLEKAVTEGINSVRKTAEENKSAIARWRNMLIGGFAVTTVVGAGAVWFINTAIAVLK